VTPATLLSAALLLAQPPRDDLAAAMVRLQASHAATQRLLNARLDRIDARLDALEGRAKPPGKPPADPDALTYAEAYALALKKKKPLVVWVGPGNVCKECVRASAKDFVHYFTDEPSAFGPNIVAPSILVYVPEAGGLPNAGVIDWWIEGSPDFGHLASIRNTIRRWREKRQVAREAGVYQPATARATTFVPAAVPPPVFTPVPAFAPRTRTARPACSS
jgi:hypothetical protein